MNRTIEQIPALPQPRIEHRTSHLPTAVTFFMTRGQRRALLDALKPVSDDRSRALLIALGLHETDDGRDEGVCS
ncbi:MAG: hypothetical protein ACF8MF_13745 [Phycisphaerales bacterium JB052]